MLRLVESAERSSEAVAFFDSPGHGQCGREAEAMPEISLGGCLLRSYRPVVAEKPAAGNGGRSPSSSSNRIE